jgi:MATE family multidrug resistance protein
MLFSLIAEPLTGLVDTLLVGQLGASSLAALGVATSLVSSVLWAFNFLTIATQTEVAKAQGAGRLGDAREFVALAMAAGLAIGVLLFALGSVAAEPLARFMGTVDTTTAGAVTYLRIRLLSAPAVLLTIAAFGALRGVQDMRTPLWIAVATNVVNLALDWLLIFGAGPIPRLELAGAAWASVAAQWMGAALALRAVSARFGWPQRIPWDRAQILFTVGRDLFLRTGLLLLFLTLGVRAATRIGTDEGAAHALIRSIWMFSAFTLDAYAHVAQSLVSYFLASARVVVARRVARVSMQWSFATGAALGLLMWLATPAFAAALPLSAQGIGIGAWRIAALSQLLSSASFATDGIHWGTGDYRYLRNAMMLCTTVGVAALFTLEACRLMTLDAVWLVTAGWVGLRGVLGMLRVWPGIGAAPLRLPER